MRIGKNWVFSLGARKDWVEQVTDNHGERTEESITTHAGLVWMPGGGWAPYLSYSESFTPKFGHDDLTGEEYVPVTGTQYEVGVRFRPPETGWAFTLAAFRIMRENEVVTDPSNPMHTIQAGVTRSRGVEVSVQADIKRNLQVDFSYTYMDVEFVETGSGYALQGNEKAGIPSHSASVWVDYTFTSGRLAGLGLGLGARYESKSWATNSNTFKHSSSFLVDAALRYDMTEHLQVQLTVQNLMGEQTVYCNGTQPLAPCYFSQPRTVLATLKAHF